MNELVTRQQEAGFGYQHRTKELIQSSIAGSHSQAIPAIIEADRNVARRADVDRCTTGGLHHRASY